MLFRKTQLIIFAVVIALFAVFTMLEFFGTAVPAIAYEQAPAEAADLALLQQAPKEPDWDFDWTPVSTDTESFALDGSVIGIGTYAGRVKCIGDNCSQKTSFVLPGSETLPEIEIVYKFSTMQALDPEEERAVVAGTGTVTSGRQKERFSFTAIFQVNDDGTGTVSSRYEASRPDASLIIPRADGVFEIRTKTK